MSIVDWRSMNRVGTQNRNTTAILYYRIRGPAISSTREGSTLEKSGIVEMSGKEEMNGKVEMNGLHRLPKINLSQFDSAELYSS